MADRLHRAVDAGGGRPASHAGQPPRCRSNVTRPSAVLITRGPTKKMQIIAKPRFPRTSRHTQWPFFVSCPRLLCRTTRRRCSFLMGEPFLSARVFVSGSGGGAVSICRFDVAEPDALRPLCLTSVLHSFVEKSLSKGIRTQEKPVYRREPRQTQSNPLTCVKNEGNQPRPINSK